VSARQYGTAGGWPQVTADHCPARDESKPVPPVAPPSDPLDLVLHIGSGKTGTSSIQYFLHYNRDRLAELGHLYPQTPGRARHTRLGLFIKPDEELVSTPSWHRQGFPSPEVFRRTFRRQLFREIKESGPSRVVFSDEALYASSDEALRRLSRFAGRIARNRRLVVYLRRQDDHLVSRYQQVVKTGETRRLDERAQNPDVKTYDYYDRLRTWDLLLQPDRFVVRRFERDRFVDGSLYQDFLDAVGIDVRADELTQAETRNESLDAESVEFLRILNILRADDETAASLVKVDRALVRMMANASTGPTLTLPSPFLDDFMAQWEESNRRVAREYLGDESGQLFRAERKTRRTTTEQYLDPSRLDHFIALLELPEQMHAPLRALVEREAKAG
jgi:hypothetical protein